MADPLITIPLDLDPKEAEQKLDQFKNKASRAGSDGGASFAAGFNKTISNGIAIAAAAAATAAVAGLGFALKKSIEEATKQENAVNALNRALAASGQFSQQASLGLQDFAEKLQNNTAVGGDLILQNAALIQSLARLDQQGLKRATTAALDLSAALGIGFEQASTLVAKAANGNVTAFQRLGINIEKGADNAQTFANALTLLETRFAGAATGKLNTFQGQIQRLGELFDSVFESIGTGIVKSPLLTALIKTLGDEFAKLAEKAKDIKFDNLFNVSNIISFGRAINEFVIAPLELVGNFAKIIFNGVNTVVAGSVALIGQKVGFIADLLNKVGVDNGLTQAFQNFRESSAEVFTGVALDTQAAVDGLFDGTVFSKGEEFLDNLQVNLESAKNAIANSGIQNAIQPAPQEGGSFIESFTAGFSQAEITLQNFAEKTKAFGQQIRTNLQAGIANGAGQAFAAFGQALATGQDALGAFAKAFIGSIGQIAIQQGAAFILQGIAYQFVPGFQAVGAGLIGAGAALATFGGALSAFAGGGAGGGAPSAAGGGSAIAGEQVIDPRSNLPAGQDRLEPATQVVVNIQGDVFDSEETGLRISNILRDASLNQNVRASVFA